MSCLTGYRCSVALTVIIRWGVSSDHTRGILTDPRSAIIHLRHSPSHTDALDHKAKIAQQAC